MVSALDSGANGPGSIPGRGTACVVVLRKTLYTRIASPPKRKLKCRGGGNLQWT